MSDQPNGGVSTIYLYGMTLLSHIHRLDGAYPEPDTYGEIKESYVLLGGETANAAIVLSHFGCRAKIGGPHLGAATRDKIIEHCRLHGIDESDLTYDPEFDGVQDLVLVDQSTRTVFGRFRKYFNDQSQRWSDPDRASIEAAQIVTIDPFFRESSELAARYCVDAGKAYVTIDCRPDSYLHRNAAANVLSNEYLTSAFPDADREELMHSYTRQSEGLVIFTSGSEPMLYGRGSLPIRSLQPYQVNVKGTLGAGDTFRAGVVYGILQQFDDTGIVRFAAATAAEVCTRFPMALNPPKVEDIRKLMDSD